MHPLDERPDRKANWPAASLNHRNAIMENANTNITSVQKNEITIDSYVAQFNSLARTTAESIVRMAEVVCSAKTNLASDGKQPNSFDMFCTQIGLTPKSSMIRKFLKIGDMASHLNGHLDKLPNSWTTIYTLACQSTDHLTKMFEKELITPTMTAQRLSEIIAAETGQAKKSNGNTKVSKAQSVTVDADNAFKLSVLFDIPPSASLVKRLDAVIRQYIESENLRARNIYSPSLIDLLDQAEEQGA